MPNSSPLRSYKLVLRKFDDTTLHFLHARALASLTTSNIDVIVEAMSPLLLANSGACQINCVASPAVKMLPNEYDKQNEECGL